MENTSKEILAKGLSEGYVGKSVSGQVNRAGFNLKTSDYSGPEGKYHDEWDADFNGGGQEIVEDVNGNHTTRVYAGGTPSPEILKSLGLIKKDVIGKLVYFVNKLNDGTRLDQDAEVVEGDWTYKYEVLEHLEEIPLDLGKEEITFKDKSVFVHFHIISPII